MQFKHVTLDIDGPVAILKLDHPEVMNAVSMDMLGGLGEALDAVDDRRSDVRCLVLTGAGRAFCAGANLQGRDNQKPGSRSNAGVTLETGYHPFLRRLRNLHCPIVTSVNGAAAGPGMSFSLIRKLYWESSDNSFEDQLDLEQQMQRRAGAAEDFREGVTAFLEKRPAKFKGK